MGLVPSQIPQPNESLKPPTPALTPSAYTPSESLAAPLIPSLPAVSGPDPIPSIPTVTIAPSLISSVHVTTTETSQMTSTDQGLKPIPPAETQVGDPNGHHEITEPNFSVTKPCRGCAPIIEVTATGWMDNAPEEQHESATGIIQTRISAGPSNVLVSQASSGGNFVIGGSLTVTLGQTVTVDSIPIAVQTASGGPHVIVGTTIISLVPAEAKPDKDPRVTYMPTRIPTAFTIGADIFVPDSQSQYIFGGQTLSPGGPAITVSGTTISLAPSATVLVVNGATSTLSPQYGNIWTKAATALTFKDHVYTANRAGHITISPGIVLKPGGEAITIDGTALSLDNSGTAVVVQGRTSILQPVTTVVTLTKSLGAGAFGGGNAGETGGGDWALPTGKAPAAPAKPISAGRVLRPEYARSDGWLSGVLLLIWWSIGYLAVGL